MKISLLEAPVCKGSPTVGSQEAFRDLIANRLQTLFGEDVRVLPMEEDASPRRGEAFSDQTTEEVMSVSRRLYETVRRELAEGRFPLVIGGDHSAAIGSIAGASAATGAETLSVVYLDGHTDINTEESSLTGYIHGMTLASAMGLCSDRLTVGRKVNLLGKNIHIVGARSIDDGEYPILRKNGVHLYPADELRRRGLAAVIEELRRGIAGRFVHLSFDVDFLDGAVFSSTSYRMPDGMDVAALRQLLDGIFSAGHVISMDVVEYNPLLDADGRDRKTLFDIFRHTAGLISSYCAAKTE